MHTDGMFRDEGQHALGWRVFGELGVGSPRVIGAKSEQGVPEYGHG